MGVEDPAWDGSVSRQLVFAAGLESHCQWRLGGVHLLESHWLEPPCGNHYAEQEVGTQRLDLEVSLSIRHGALAAIRIAGGSGVAPAHARSCSVNQYLGARHRVALCAHHATHKVGSSWRECRRAGRQGGIGSKGRNLRACRSCRPRTARLLCGVPKEQPAKHDGGEQTNWHQPETLRFGFVSHVAQLNPCDNC